MNWLVAGKVEQFGRKIQPMLLRLCGPRGPLSMLSPMAMAFVRARRKLTWERLWNVERRRPVEHLSTALPAELVEAVESGWIPAGSSIMDVGAGRGQISAWLAEHGFQVIGVDLSSEATRLANEHFRHVSDRLEFRTLDVCSGTPEPARFDAFIDRGCYHGIPPPLKKQYVANMAVWAKPGARFLLLSKADDDGRRVVSRVTAAFDPYFKVVRTEATVLTRSTGPYPRTVRPGRVFWMVRRDADRRPG